MPTPTARDKVISTILKHDTKVTSYKIALLRAINDFVLSFPDVHRGEKDVAVPLRMLAELWIAYYWPFVDAPQPILQGQRIEREGHRRNHMSFRPPHSVTGLEDTLSMCFLTSGHATHKGGHVLASMVKCNDHGRTASRTEGPST